MRLITLVGRNLVVPESVQIPTMLVFKIIPTMVAVREAVGRVKCNRVEWLMRIAHQVQYPAQVNRSLFLRRASIVNDAGRILDRLYNVHVLVIVALWWLAATVDLEFMF